MNRPMPRYPAPSVALTPPDRWCGNKSAILRQPSAGDCRLLWGFSSGTGTKDSSCQLLHSWSGPSPHRAALAHTMRYLYGPIVPIVGYAFLYRYSLPEMCPTVGRSPSAASDWTGPGPDPIHLAAINKDRTAGFCARARPCGLVARRFMQSALAVAPIEMSSG